jgi:hypothetical protein
MTQSAAMMQMANSKVLIALFRGRPLLCRLAPEGLGSQLGAFRGHSFVPNGCGDLMTTGCQ